MKIEILINLSSMIGGAFLSIAISAYIERSKTHRRKEFFGKWKSAYQSLDYRKEWVEEDVVIDPHWTKIRIRNSDNEANLEYTAISEILARAHLKGKYTSNRPGAHAVGAFLLTISPGGNMLYGYWIGPNDKSEKRYAGWVLGRTPEDLDTAKKILLETSPNTKDFEPSIGHQRGQVT